jgi:hypothetical protein
LVIRFSALHRRREQVRVTVGNRSASHIASRSLPEIQRPPASSASRTRSPQLIEVQLVPRALDPEIVQLLPVNTGHAVRIFDADDHCLRKGLASERAIPTPGCGLPPQ